MLSEESNVVAGRVELSCPRTHIGVGAAFAGGQRGRVFEALVLPDRDIVRQLCGGGGEPGLEDTGFVVAGELLQPHCLEQLAGRVVDRGGGSSISVLELPDNEVKLRPTPANRMLSVSPLWLSGCISTQRLPKPIRLYHNAFRSHRRRNTGWSRVPWT